MLYKVTVNILSWTCQYLEAEEDVLVELVQPQGVLLYQPPREVGPHQLLLTPVKVLTFHIGGGGGRGRM
jgi:hypothetical protein